MRDPTIQSYSRLCQKYATLLSCSLGYYPQCNELPHPIQTYHVLNLPRKQAVLFKSHYFAFGYVPRKALYI